MKTPPILLAVLLAIPVLARAAQPLIGPESAFTQPLKKPTKGPTWGEKLELRGIFCVSDYGADPTGVTNSTVAIQAAVNASVGHGVMLIPRGTYLVGQINVTNGVSIRSDFATLKMRPATTPFTAGIFLYGSTNITVTGQLRIDGNFAQQTVPTIGVYVIGDCDHVRFDALTITGCSMDGLYVGNNGYPRNVAFGTVTVADCGRNNISITSGQDISFGSVTVTGALGADPGCGIDIEPNFPTDVLNDIHFGSVTATANSGSGVQLLGKMNGANWVHGNISFKSLVCRSNAFNGIGMTRVQNITVSKFDGSWNDNGVTVDTDVRNVWVAGDAHDNRCLGIYVLNGITQTNRTYNLHLNVTAFNNSQLHPGSNAGLDITSH